ncbi:hypothetical protein IEQ34_016140 [Dendrobium chrysotoxum]|uniref:U-box domain-containing protein n=1 Tax=Dendrobium chrysotoxum TaxID=161865 RepID=A0AAV7GCL2_DENCH|nr:hypothetical protein IEQ34_016140 [Dendrobium chrysotoxum]
MDLQPNYTLKKSIEEWRERNIIITIAILKTKSESDDDEQEVLHSLDRLEEFCKEDSHHDWFVFENYLPVLVGLLERKSLEIRCHALFVLYILAKESDDTKEQLASIGKLIEFVVMSLGRCSEERKLAVALLLELSRTKLIHNKIGKAHGCIFLLVTTKNDGDQAASDATQLLENLSYLDENVVKMAKANYLSNYSDVLNQEMMM